MYYVRLFVVCQTKFATIKGMNDSATKVYEIVARIPNGKVATYGMVARLSGVKNPRLVGSLLHKNPDPKNIPCHRVVNAQGKLAMNFAFGGKREQARRLRKEGISVDSESSVDLKKYLWNPRN